MFSLGPATTYAMMPVPPQDFLCSSTEVIVGTVTKAARLKWDEAVENNCGNRKWECPVRNSCQWMPHTIHLRVKVIKVWARPASLRSTDAAVKGVTVGRTIELTTGLWNDACSRTGYDAQGFLAVDPPVKGETIAGSVSVALLQKLYVGKAFVFAIGPDTPAEGDSRTPVSYGAYMFRMSEFGWAAEILRTRKGAQCPKLLISGAVR